MSGILQTLFLGAVATVKDAYFNLVTLLLNTTSTNGAQNNTFLDSSTNNFTITRNGNTTQGTFTPFSQAPGYWGNYFGSNNYLTVPYNANFLWSTGARTYEAWVYVTSVASNNAIFALTNLSSSNIWELYINTSSQVVFRYFTTSAQTITTTGTVPLNTWAHVAFVYDGTSAITIYINGVISGTGTKTGTPVTGSDQLCIGRTNVGTAGDVSFSGYISNARFTTTTVYTSAFTPQTTPLTAITNTTLLTCQSNRFVDNSASPATVTANGSPSVQAFSPFAPTTAYDTAVVGGSGYFDGSGDYIVTPSNAAVSSTLLASDFTIECWLYLTTYPGGGAPIWTNSTSNSDGFSSSYVTSSGTVAIGKVGVNEVVSTATVVRNAWNHFATVRSGATVYLYLNGAQIVSGAASTYLNTSSAKPLQIAQSNQSSPANLTGYISGYRAVNSALYTGSTYTIPTTVPTAISGTQLLLNFTNAGIYDSAAKNDLETVGNAQVSTTQAKWGSTSMYFDGAGDTLILPNSPIYDFGTGNFTIEGWVYVIALSGSAQETFIGRGVNGGASFHIALTTGGAWVYYLSSNNSSWNIASAVNIGTNSLNTWQHIALVRNGTTFTPYLNGVAGTTTTNSSAIYWNSGTSNVNQITIGGSEASTQVLNGYIDDLRITIGYARYTTNFTPPSAAFPIQ